MAHASVGHVTDLLLVGAGHGHLHALTRAPELASAGYRVHLLAPPFFDYSGVASATAAGTLPGDVGRVDVRALAAASGVTFHEGTLASLDTDRRVATSSEGEHLPYDVLSLNIGSVVAPGGIRVDPGVVRVKPLGALAELDVRLRALDHAGTAVTVVGGGATGLELSAHLAVRPDVARVRLVESGPRVGDDLPPGARRRLERLLVDRGVEVHTGCAVREIRAQVLICEDGTEIEHDVALLATGLSAPPLLVEWGLGGALGVPVRATLQHRDHDEIYAVGDCADFLPGSLPRIGVHGVRQGPVLVDSLLARVRGEGLPTYEPQRRALAILDLGAGVGLAVRGRWWWYGATALHLKRAIDRRWLRRYRTGSNPGPHRVPPS